MPKKFKTNKGERSFDTGMRRADIEAALANEGVTEYEPLDTFDEDAKAIIERNAPLSFGAAAASLARPATAAATAGAIMSRIPYPVARVLGGILGYIGADQGMQEGIRQVTGERPKGAIEQLTQPGNEAVGRLMGTAENAALDKIGNYAGDKIANILGGLYTKVSPQINKLAPVAPSPIIQASSGGKGFKTTTELPPLWEMPIKPTTLKNGVWHEDPMTSRIVRSLEEELIRRDAITQSEIGQLRKSAMTELEKKGASNQRFSEFYGQTLKNYLSKPTTIITPMLALGAPNERKEKMKIATGPIQEFEVALQDKQSLMKPDTRDDLRAYWIQSRLQSGNAMAALNEPAAATLYTPNERKELATFFKAVDEKKLPPDIKLTPKGVQISGPMAEEAGFTGGLVTLGLFEFGRRILLRQGTRAAAKAVADYAAGNASKIPARRMGKYFLRNALRGADVLMQTAEGEKEVTVE